MARPRKEGGAKVAVTVRLDPAVLDELDRQRRRVQPVRTRSVVIERLVAEAFPSPHPMPLIDVLADDALTGVATCQHPRTARQVHGYATMCGQCGARVR